MDFDVISDVHLEENKLDDVFSALPRKARKLIIAGDVVNFRSSMAREKLIAFLTVCCRSVPGERGYDMVFYVLGNHEHYSFADVCSASIASSIKSLESLFGNLKVLENEHYVFEAEKTILFGATLWSNVKSVAFPSNIPIYVHNDIYNKNMNITQSQWVYKHYEAINALERVIQFARYLGYKLVVVTHYAPIFNVALNPRHHGDAKNEFYCTDLSRYFGSVDLWIFGHTSHNCDVTIDGTRIYSNQYKVHDDSYRKDSVRVPTNSVV